MILCNMQGIRICLEYDELNEPSEEIHIYLQYENTANMLGYARPRKMNDSLQFDMYVYNNFSGSRRVLESMTH